MGRIVFYLLIAWFAFGALISLGYCVVAVSFPARAAAVFGDSAHFVFFLHAMQGIVSAAAIWIAVRGFRIRATKHWQIALMVLPGAWILPDGLMIYLDLQPSNPRLAIIGMINFLIFVGVSITAIRANKSLQGEAG